ncbi:Predicted nuclease of the RNAse H fold, HicB family [Soonwooa buanensis]|uniref:Predicted nuclease of the RNAse H fold, HicB family n=1 Tax=Soonwooa buanensis TaxID=619805 RepID=A0A1T5FDV0_9FLAO|nr:type II toxin-antitoxin system HicB family antitoxin [Soonwooa buanensis]SKB94286.1 Predicted nuclease of the RNAse H fold, HicB family [Soonwooa buanensis]
MGVLKYKHYIGSVEYSETDKILFGKVQGIRGLISYEGQNVDELEQDFKNGIDDYLEECKMKGIEPQKSYTGAFNVRIPSDMHGKAVLKANELGINLNAFVKTAIEEKLQNLELKRTSRPKRNTKEKI